VDDVADAPALLVGGDGRVVLAHPIGLVEVAHRRGTRLALATRKARFPFLRTIEEFDFTHPSQPGLCSATSAFDRFGQARSTTSPEAETSRRIALSFVARFASSMSLNRFNVMASRARAKLVVLVSQEVVNHLPKDPEVLRQSALLKTYTETYCDKSRPMRLGIVGVQPHVVNGTFRWR
jgi:hypothetical protein